MPYDSEMVRPMREELTRLGVQELRTAAEVDRFLGDQRGTALLIINSVCGCAAGAARPGVALALQHGNLPDRTATVFAGQDVEATSRAREMLGDYPPSSPSFALLREGRVVRFVPRHLIEGRDPYAISEELTSAFDRWCRR